MHVKGILTCHNQKTSYHGCQLKGLPDEQTWFTDSSASNHITSDIANLSPLKTSWAQSSDDNGADWIVLNVGSTH